MADIPGPGALPATVEERSHLAPIHPDARQITPPDPWTPAVAPWRRNLDRALLSRLESLVAFLLARWALLLSAASALVVLGAYLSPALLRLGYPDAGRALFEAYSYICEQTPGHSYYLWGYQAAIDQRLTALYGAVALAGLTYCRLGRRAQPLGWWTYLLLILPMALDGFTQMFGWRHSTWELRTLTGALFGAATVWLLYPRLDRALADSVAGRNEGLTGKAGSDAPVDVLVQRLVTPPG